MDAWDFLRPLIVLASVVVTTAAMTFLLGRLAHVALRRRRGTDDPLWTTLRRSRASFVCALGSILLLSANPATHLPHAVAHPVDRVLTLAVIMTCAWLAVHAASVLVDAWFERYANAAADDAQVRRVRTQVDLIRRITAALVIVVALGAWAMTFPTMRAVGTSLLASAGLIGVVAGLAAQSTLAQLFAGLQIAFSDLVRIGDDVVVQGERGTIEEITLTYIVVHTWDQRRLVMPVSYFTGRPFENWSRTDTRLTGAVFLHLDHSTPVPALRDELHRLLQASPLWDGQGWSLYVTDTTPTTILVRAVATARDADDVFVLRCDIREKLIDFLRREHPYALPRVATSPAATADALVPAEPVTAPVTTAPKGAPRRAVELGKPTSPAPGQTISGQPSGLEPVS